MTLGWRGVLQDDRGNGESPWVRGRFRGPLPGREAGAGAVTVQGAGVAHQMLERTLRGPPPEPPGRNTAGLQHTRGRRRRACAGMHAAAGAAIRICLREIARWKRCEGTRFYFVFSGRPPPPSDGFLTRTVFFSECMCVCVPTSDISAHRPTSLGSALRRGVSDAAVALFYQRAQDRTAHAAGAVTRVWLSVARRPRARRAASLLRRRRVAD